MNSDSIILMNVSINLANDEKTEAQIAKKKSELTSNLTRNVKIELEENFEEVELLENEGKKKLKLGLT